MPAAHAIGIDLGTTYSAVARLDQHGRTQMVRNVEGDLLTPSVVLFDRDETVVGRDAKKAAATRPSSVAQCAKRDMGQPAYSQPINGATLPPEVIQACILRKLHFDVATQVGEPFKVVITVPAFFDEPRRKATFDAGEMAGLSVLNIVNEPTAAALAYGESLGYLSETGAPREAMNVLVYDLGGGTFDVTVISLKPGEITTLATDGDVRLGGYDWDARLIDHVSDVFRRQTGLDPRQEAEVLGRLRLAVEEAKHTLTARDGAKVHVEAFGQTLDVPISRGDFEELTADLLERTAFTTRQVLSSTELSWSDVSRILLVGGSSRMPMVAKMLEQMTGVRPDLAVNPDECVARGAAIFAGYLLAAQGESTAEPEFSVVDVNSHSLGIEGINQQTMRKENTILIPHNTPLPAQAIRKFVTKADNQMSVVIQVLEGESNLPSQCTPIGRAVIRNLPPGLSKGTRIDVVYRYGANARLAVRAKVAGTNHETGIDLERDEGMTAHGVTRWRRVLSSEGGFDAIVKAVRELKEQARASRKTPGGEVDSAAADPQQTVAFPAGNPSTPQHASVGMSSPAGLATHPQSTPAAGTPDSGPLAGQTAAIPATPAGAPKTRRGSGEALRALSSPAASNTATFRADEIDGGAAPAARGNRRRRVFLITTVGHIVASTLGLSIGYYVLCLLRPEANFLKLPLPGIQQTTPLEDTNENAAQTQPPSPHDQAP